MSDDQLVENNATEEDDVRRMFLAAADSIEPSDMLYRDVGGFGEPQQPALKTRQRSRTNRRAFAPWIASAAAGLVLVVSAGALVLNGDEGELTVTPGAAFDGEQGQADISGQYSTPERLYIFDPAPTDHHAEAMANSMLPASEGRRMLFGNAGEDGPFGNGDLVILVESGLGTAPMRLNDKETIQIGGQQVKAGWSENGGFEFAFKNEGDVVTLTSTSLTDQQMSSVIEAIIAVGIEDLDVFDLVGYKLIADEPLMPAGLGGTAYFANAPLEQSVYPNEWPGYSIVWTTELSEVDEQYYRKVDQSSGGQPIEVGEQPAMFRPGSVGYPFPSVVLINGASERVTLTFPRGVGQGEAIDLAETVRLATVEEIEEIHSSSDPSKTDSFDPDKPEEGERFELPNVYGEDEEVVYNLLNDAGFTEVVSQGENSVTVAPDQVIRTEPEPGVLVDSDERITVFVSEGPDE